MQYDYAVTQIAKFKPQVNKVLSYLTETHYPSSYCRLSMPHNSKASPCKLTASNISNIGIHLGKLKTKSGGCSPLSRHPAEKAKQKSGIWHHLFLSCCDQSGDLLLCFNSEVKGACGMRMGIVCGYVCVYRGIEESFALRWDPMDSG